MQKILVLGAGKSATDLIEELLSEAFSENWLVIVADGDFELASLKVGQHERGRAEYLSIDDEERLSNLIAEVDIVVSMLPPSLHSRVALRCVTIGRHFINASYLTPDIRQLNEMAQEKGILVLCELGLDPGIDHMSAIELINSIKNAGGKIQRFRSHCGGLIAPESDNSPWHYKISWNPRNIVTAGKKGASYLENGSIKHLSYYDLFDPMRTVEVPEAGIYAWYPNRDSIPYMQLYQLEGITEFVRTTLRHPDFCRVWKLLVQRHLTDESILLNTDGISYKEYFENKIGDLSSLDGSLLHQLRYLGAFKNDHINLGMKSPADILQLMLEKALALQPNDNDMIIMLHEIGYVIDGKKREKKAFLILKGTDGTHTAMSKTVGLPLAIVTKLILNGKMKRSGVCLPIHEDIIYPVLRNLEKKGVSFTIVE